jgi:hypothetical protein
MPKIGYCGDDCELCPRYIATLRENPAELIHAADIWIKAGWKDKGTPPEALVCYGCLSVKECYYDTIQKCAQSRKIANCGECVDYPCDKITFVFKRTESYAKKCKQVCSPVDYNILANAFFFKKKTLDRIHKRKFASYLPKR